MKKKKKILSIILLIIVLLIASVIIIVFACFNKIKSEQKNAEVILNEDGSKKALILYQDSLFSLTKKIINETSIMLSENDYSVTMNHPRSDLTYNVSDYDIVILATPVYASNVAKPILDYGKNNDFNNTSVIVIVTGQIIDETSEIEEIIENVNNPKEIKGIKINGITDDFKTFINENIN